MQITLNKTGECGGCIYFNRMYDHNMCKFCERNPQIAQVLKDNKTKSDRNLLPDGVFQEGEGSPLTKLDESNKKELGEFGIMPGAVDRMVQQHDKRGGPATRRRS